ncbi:MAG TPA: LysR family transcriptional regulator [Roseiarcus sp.]|nr:LysR family transcriptional regulator [Roseiarcus sp.]
MSDEPSWDLYRSFLAVLREGSLSAAARALGLTQPTVARHIDGLEAAIRFPLFTRSQQGLAATEAALELQPYAESLAATTAALLRAASGQGRAVGGAVRVSASEVIGAEVLPPILARLREDHPALEIELVLSNAVDNLLRRDADIAVRMVEPIQEALVVKRVGAVTLGLHAHRTYLARAGAPRDVKDLRTHSLIGFDRETPAIRSMLQRAPALDGLRFALRTDSDTAQLMAIKAGFGIGVCQTALARRDRDLERVLPDAFALELGVWLAMHENLRSTPRCRAVFDGLAAGLKAHVD